MNMQYTLATSKGTSGGSNEANTAGNNAKTLEQFDYEDGYNNFDVRHTFNISCALFAAVWRGRKYGHNANALSHGPLGGGELRRSSTRAAAFPSSSSSPGMGHPSIGTAQRDSFTAVPRQARGGHQYAARRPVAQRCAVPS
jgi:hypothetical protein